MKLGRIFIHTGIVSAILLACAFSDIPLRGGASLSGEDRYDPRATAEAGAPAPSLAPQSGRMASAMTSAQPLTGTILAVESKELVELTASLIDGEVTLPRHQEIAQMDDYDCLSTMIYHETSALPAEGDQNRDRALVHKMILASDLKREAGARLKNDGAFCALLRVSGKTYVNGGKVDAMPDEANWREAVQIMYSITGYPVMTETYRFAQTQPPVEIALAK